MFTKGATALCLFSMFCLSLHGQGLNTNQTKDDWEEINFEFNSAILSDGYPSLLRLADLLQKNPTFKVRLEGNTDHVGGKGYNQKLGHKRAETVKSFLVKYGANATQVDIASRGKDDPEVSNQSREGRFINRRVAVRVTDANGKVISAGGIGDAIKSMAVEPPPQQAKCCDDLLKRLDRLDEIVNMLKDLGGLKNQVAAQQKAIEELRGQVNNIPKPLQRPEVEDITRTTTADVIEKARMKRFSLLGLNAGMDDNRNVTFTGKGRYFAPFKEKFALQAEGEYMYWHNRQEGQVDFGLVDRFIHSAQAGLFASFKHVDIRGMQNSATVGQASMTLDWLFSRGRVGVFGSKGFMNGGVINRSAVLNPFGPSVLMNETYLRVVDQAGASTSVGVYGPVYLEANLGYLKSRGYADRPGGTARLVFPLSDRFAFTLEGGVNETLLAQNNYGRVAAGFAFGNFMRPKDYAGVDHAVPADIPRVRYEMLTRQVRTGYLGPIANAGTDQIGVAAGTVTLNASESYSPEGLALNYQWSQVAGPSVTLNGAASATPSFSADASQSYSFRLTVRDARGAQASARTNVTTRANPGVRINTFIANPTSISAGQAAVLSWNVSDATDVTIGGIGAVDAKAGTTSVSPTVTTTYTLTAKNSTTTQTQTATVTVANPSVRIIGFTASPMTLIAGQSSTLSWATDNAITVAISGLGTVANNGSQSVTPAATTTYTLTATTAGGQPQTAQVTVQVNAAPMPRIIRFTVGPLSIVSGNRATLVWAVENSDTVAISGVGNVPLVGTQDVTPTANTTYTLTASNGSGQVTAQTTLTVTAPPPPPAPAELTVSNCVASPATLQLGQTSTISWNQTGATALTVSPLGSFNPFVPLVVKPTATTTYTLAFGNSANQQANCQVTVVVNTPPAPPTPASTPTVVVLGAPVWNMEIPWMTLDASASSSPVGNTPLSYV
ncbi:MAG: OmpA family protein, partial [Acidobacteria bacterium]|nr:OmpA family protein [Acidobacteriota bacterium]